MKFLLDQDVYATTVRWEEGRGKRDGVVFMRF